MNRQKNTAYQGYMVQFMSYLHGMQYDKDHIFDNESLYNITPDDVTRWLCVKCFGVEYPDPDDPPSLCRSTSLEVYKKALSWYMPNRIQPWDCRNNTGNPTKSKEVNEIIKHVKKKEVRKQGKAPASKRALTQAEFRAILVYFFEKQTFQYRYRYSSMLLYQYYLIARCDDVAHFLINDLHAHTDPAFSSFTLQTKVTWSKNVLEERNCPDQIFFGSFDPQYCLLLSLSIYLEVWFCDTNRHQQKAFLFADDDPEDPKAVERIKANYSTTLRKYFVVSLGLSSELGTHSIRKYAASWARALGCLMDEIENRGRWRTATRRIVDRYVNVEQMFLDAKVAAALCVGGAIKYCLVDNSGVTTLWLKENVVPGLCNYFGEDNKIVDVLALPLLWVCMNPDMKETAPLAISIRVQQAYEQIRVLDLNINPVKRVFLAINRYQDTVTIDEIVRVDGDHDDASQGELQTTRNNNNNNDTNLLLTQMQQIRHSMAAHFDGIQQQQNNLRMEMIERHKILTKNINRIFIQPPRMGTQQQRQDREARNNFLDAAEEVAQPQLVAELGKAPKSIYDLWTEYAFGSGGRKAAKDFNVHERGKCRFNYSRRKVVWDCIALHVNAGFLAATACDRILECYGRNQTVTAIINAMVKDKKHGGHPNLRV
jgi:hypothetical protein